MVRRSRRILGWAAISGMMVSLSGCSSWESIDLAGGQDPSLPRSGDHVKILTRDGSTLTGDLVSIDADSLYCEHFTLARTTIDEVYLVESSPDPWELTVGAQTHLTLRNGQYLEGCLMEATRDSLHFDKLNHDIEFADAPVFSVARVDIIALEQSSQTTADKVGAVLAITLAATMGIILGALIYFSANPVNMS